MIDKVIPESYLIERIAVIMGTRPGIIKMSPLVKELATRNVDNFIIHTGQHYSSNLDAVFFRALGLPKPLARVDSTKRFSTHAEQTSEMMRGVEKVLYSTRPKVVLVCGDANTNLAAGLAARKLGIIVGHVEAGLRSHDWSMPEEHNRVMLDHISELLFAPTLQAYRNLVMDNVRGQIVLSGNTIVDSTLHNISIAQRNHKVLSEMGLKEGEYFVLTSHREENVDVKLRLENILEGLKRVSTERCLPVIFPVHPRTRKRLEAFGLLAGLNSSERIRLVEPLGYLEFLVLIKNAALIFTDSGGIQEESCILRTPCITLRDNTERPETIDVGSNCLAGTDPKRIHNAANEMRNIERNWDIPFGDGQASGRIIDAVESALLRGVKLIDVSKKPRWEVESVQI
jgi:UDP-N-acetylglucosamine 2-epimerase (non-hydrolysing)